MSHGKIERTAQLRIKREDEECKSYDGNRKAFCICVTPAVLDGNCVILINIRQYT